MFSNIFGYAVSVIAILSVVSQQAFAFSELLFIPWGTGAGEVKQRWHPSGSYGPTDFRIKNTSPRGELGNYLYLLDCEQDLIQVFDLASGELVETAPVPSGSESFALRDDKIAVWDGESLHIGRWGATLLRSSSGHYPFHVIRRLLWRSDTIMAVDERNRTFVVAVSEMAVQPEDVRQIDDSDLPRITRKGDRSLSIGLKNGSMLEVSHGLDLGASDYIGEIDGRHYVLSEEILSYSPIDAREILFALSEFDNCRKTIRIPFVYYSLFPRAFGVFGNSLYAFISSLRGLHLFVAGPERLRSDKLSFSHFPEEPYHYNYFAPEVPPGEGEGGIGEEGPISRSEMMSVARSYVDLLWTASDANITSDVEMMPDGTMVRTPSWVTVGLKQKAPYKWGGFTSLLDFSSGVSAGKKCGDDFLGSMGNSDLYCIGVDCSGFVSRCWGTERKYVSATMHEISSELPSFRDMLQGDALNKPHHHIRLCAEDNPTGLVLTIESGGDWRVSYHALKLTSLVGYIPIRFDEVVGDRAISPFVIKVKETVDQVPVRRGPSANEPILTSISDGQRYVSTSFHNGWYHFDAPTGTGTYGGWSYGGTTSTNGHLEGSQETSVAIIEAFALNVRAGPGLNYSYVTTVGQGQRFAVLDSSNQWYQIQIACIPGRDSGWICIGDSVQNFRIVSGDCEDGYGARVISLDHPSEMNERDSDLCSLEIVNTGYCSWDSSTLIRTTVPRGRSSLFATSVWIDSSTVVEMGARVLPFQKHSISFGIQAPCVVMDSLFGEHFGFEQAGHFWFGDGEIGPPDIETTMNILVRDAGLPLKPVIDLSGIQPLKGTFTLTWRSVSGVTHYGVYRGVFGSHSPPSLVATTSKPIFNGQWKNADPAHVIHYSVRAFAPADSSAFSNMVGKFDFSLLECFPPALFP